jgi:hypothetical protein
MFSSPVPRAFLEFWISELAQEYRSFSRMDACRPEQPRALNLRPQNVPAFAAIVLAAFSGSKLTVIAST